jgi:hypothetical protein
MADARIDARFTPDAVLAEGALTRVLAGRDLDGAPVILKRLQRHLLWDRHCVEMIDQGKIPAPIVYRPSGAIESAGGDMNASGCLIDTIQPDQTPVDFTVMPFVSREQIERIGTLLSGR